MAPASSSASAEILRRRAEFATALVDRVVARAPVRTESSGRDQSLRDAGDHLSHLAQALAVDSTSLFIDYIAWAKVMLAQRPTRQDDLAFQLECLADVLKEMLPGTHGATAERYVRAAIQALPGMPEDLPTFLDPGEPMTPLAHQYLEALRRGERQLASRLVLDAVAAGTSVRDIYLHVFQPAQYEIGRLWQTNRVTVAQEHYCTAATQLIMSLLYPQIFATEKKGRTLVATGVAGDLHELGARMVADFFEMDGWHTYYLGANTPHTGVVATLTERSADVLAISATMPYHLEATRELIATVRAEPELRQVKILVGGHPFNRDPQLWQQIGADGTARDAANAIACADRLLLEAGA